MPVTVEVPEHGLVEFPDRMNQEQMEAAIRDRFAPPSPAAAAEKARVNPLEAKLFGGPRPTDTAETPRDFASNVNAVMGAVGRAATGVANLPSRLHNALQPYGERSASYVPLLEADKPKLVIPQIQPEQMEGESKATQVAAGVYNKLAEFGTGLTTPGVGLTMAVLPAGIAKAAFGTQIAANIPGTIQESAKTLRDPSASLMEKGGAAAVPLAEAWMLKTIIKAAPVLPNAARAAAEAIGKETLKKGVADASRQQQTAEVHGDVQPQPEQGAGQVPGQESSAGVQPQAPSQTAQPVRLSPEHQQLLDIEKATVDVPVETTAELDPNNAPFAQAKAGQIATIDRKRGTIVIDPAQFAGWINEDMAKLSPEQKRLAVRSMLAEERNHLATSAADAGAYWNSLSAAEKALEQKLYTGSFKGRGDVIGTDLGFEAIRRRFQQLARMDSTEVAQRAGAERWGYKSLEALNSAIRGIRETLGTKASKEGLAILDKVQGNLDAAKAALGGQPAALRKKRTTDDERQQGFLLPETKGKGVLSKPPTQPATEGSPELRGKPVSGAELESDAAKHLTETARPSFADFASAAKTKYGPELQSGQLRELWQDQVWKRLESATGPELGRLRDQLGLGREVGTREVAGATPPDKGFQLEGQVEGGARSDVRTLDAAGRERQLAQQRYRANVMARIGEKLIAESETGRKAWRRQEVTPDEVATWRETSEGAFRAVYKDEAKDPESLGRSLTEGAAVERSTVRRSARGGQKVEVRTKAPPETVTKRLTAFLNKATGKVELVSTYRSGRTGAMVVDPVKLGSMRPNVPLANVLGRYQPLYSVLLDEPVQNFHQSFDSVRDFEDRFGQEARRRVEESRVVAEPPIDPNAPPEQPGALMRGRPLTDAEAGAVLDHLYDEVSTIDSPEDMRDALNALTVAASERRLSGRDRQVISALDKATEATKKRFPLLTENQAVDQALDEFYGLAKNAQSREAFVQSSLERFGSEAPKAVQGKPGVSGQATGARELTLPRFARRATPGQAEASPPVPEGSPGKVTTPEKLAPDEEAFVKELAAIKSAHRSEPAALRPLREAKERTLAEAERVYRGISTLVNRRDIKEGIPAARDAADTSANTLARQAEIDVRTFANLSAKTPRAPKEVLNGLMPMVTSHAITADYDLNYATPEGRQTFLTMTYRDPKWKKATMQRMSPDPKEVAEGIWTQQRMKANAYGHLIASRDLRVENARYGFEDSAKDQLDGYMAKIDAGAAKLRAKRATGGWLDKWQAGHDLKVLQKMREDLSWVKNNWSNADLRSGALEMRKQLDFRYQREADNGYNLRYDQDYVPGRYEGELFNDQAILFPGIRILGRQWRQAKTFETMYDAAEAGYVPVTRDGANIVGHRARQGERSIQYKQWTENLKNIVDPVSGLPVAAKAKRGPDGRLRPPSNEYKLMTLRPGDDPVAVHEAYERLVDQMTAQSRITDFAPARVVLELEQRLKHTLLVGDFFHLGRLSYYAGSIMGRKAGFKGGLAALDYSGRALPEAVRQGRVTQREADYVNEQIPVKQGAATIMRSRRELAGDLQQQGLNVGQIQDALYKDLTGNVPLVGPYNKWLFDSYTRGLMMESALHEFERLNKSRPDIDSKVLMRDIARDTNRFFGSIGRQGWFKSRTWQDISRLAFLAPQWVEGLVMKEAGFAKRTAGAGLRGVGLPGGRAGLPPMGTIGKGVGTGLLTMLVLTQAINLAFRRKPTWENEEDGHKWDAWIPGGDHGFFLSPLSVFNELTHDLVRYGETKPKAWDAVEQIGQNKLSPFGRLALVLATSKSPTGEYQTTTKGVLGKAAEQLAPAPISFGRVAREVGHAVAPGMVAPNAPGVLQRQGMQWAGLKAEPAGSASQRVSVMARRFMEANHLGQSGFQFETTDQPSYVKLRSALRNGDLNGAGKIMQDIGKSPTEIGKAMKNWAAHSWTGSRKSDRAFFASLTDSQMRVVSDARLERQNLLEKFYDFLLSSP